MKLLEKGLGVLLSMTGFGDAQHQSELMALAIEVRAVNNRHLKVTVRGTEPYPMLEPELEKTVRKYIRRGTILVHIRCDRQFRPCDLKINPVALRSYMDQIQQICAEAGWKDQVPYLLGQILTLRGVTGESAYNGRPDDEEWNLVEATLEAALQKLQKMRQEEGQAMADELIHHRDTIGQELKQIREVIPTIRESYQQRLMERVSQFLAQNNVGVQPPELIREVALFAERSDISEEVMRLSSHLDQFRQIVHHEKDGPGRKLEFLTQEMFREANTIGSKAGDVAISRHVVEIKATIEKIRELVQNVE